MKRRMILVVVLVILLSCAVFLIRTSTENISMEEALIGCFDSSKADILESTLSCWTQINDRFMTPEQVRDETTRVLRVLNVSSDSITRLPQNDEQTNKEITYASNGDKSYSVVIESIKADDKGETYIVIDMTIDKSYEGLLEERQKIQTLFAEQGKNTKLNSCIIGTFDGKLSDEDMRGKISSSLKAINAKRVEGMDNEEMSSTTAFSSSIDNFVLSDNKKVNMQMALRYSEYDDKTYIWIGTPLIPVEY